MWTLKVCVVHVDSKVVCGACGLQRCVWCMYVHIKCYCVELTLQKGRHRVHIHFTALVTKHPSP